MFSCIPNSLYFPLNSFSKVFFCKPSGFLFNPLTFQTDIFFFRFQQECVVKKITKQFSRAYPLKSVCQYCSSHHPYLSATCKLKKESLCIFLYVTPFAIIPFLQLVECFFKKSLFQVVDKGKRFSTFYIQKSELQPFPKHTRNHTDKNICARFEVFKMLEAWPFTELSTE